MYNQFKIKKSQFFNQQHIRTIMDYDKKLKYFFKIYI